MVQVVSAIKPWNQGFCLNSASSGVGQLVEAHKEEGRL